MKRLLMNYRTERMAWNGGEKSGSGNLGRNMVCVNEVLHKINAVQVKFIY